MVYDVGFHIFASTKYMDITIEISYIYALMSRYTFKMTENVLSIFSKNKSKQCLNVSLP